MFTDAAFSTGGGIPGSGAQMGAHLQSLFAAADESDSGFASGISTDTTVQVTTVNPEPSSLVLGGLGALGCLMGTWRRKRASKN
jgi:hypothetical protein